MRQIVTVIILSTILLLSLGAKRSWAGGCGCSMTMVNQYECSEPELENGHLVRHCGWHAYWSCPCGDNLECGPGYYACSFEGGGCCKIDVPAPTGGPVPTGDGGGCTPNCSGTYCGTIGDGCGGTCACKECETCERKCGQVKDCNFPESCTSEDVGIPDAPTIVSTKADVLGHTMILTLSWASNSTLTDLYEVEVFNLGTGATVWTGRTADTTINTAAIPVGVFYNWQVRAVNNTCGGANASDWTIAVAASVVLQNESKAIVAPDSTNRNNICQTAFNSGTPPRRIRLEITGYDAAGGDQIDNLEASFSRNGLVESSWTINHIGTTAESYLATGLSSFFDAVTVSPVNDKTRTVNFPIEFANNYDNDLYLVELKVVDKAGVTSRWSDGRQFKIWDCKVSVSGTVYDGSTSQNCAIGVGFSKPVTPGFNFLSIGYTEVSPGRSSVPMVVNFPARYSTGSEYIMWGRDYSPVFNSDIQGAGQVIRMTDKGDAGANKVTCYATNQVSLLEDSGGSYTINPYSNNPTALIDFSYLADQEAWFQVMGAGVMSQNRLETNVPITCALSPSTCKAATAIDGTYADGGLLSGAVITTNSGCELGSQCKYGETNNWSKETPILSGNDRMSYHAVMNRYFGINGVGVTINGDSNMSTVLASGIGGTGVIFVNGNFTVDADNTVAVGKFMMIVAKGTISFDTAVSNSAGIFMADKGIVAGGLSNHQLVIDGVLFSSGSAPAGDIRLSRGFVIRHQNNTQPGVVVNYRPDFVFNMPGKVARVLSGWKTAL
jgi:hypothetical protein